MRCPQVILIALCCASPVFAAHSFSGERALQSTARSVALGPRPSGSPAIRKLHAMILTSLRSTGCQVSTDDFQAQTPEGQVAMRNILCRFPGTSGRAIVITGHYDTKRLPGFVGANDGGSSTGFLLELARALSGEHRTDDVIIVFFDGEEAVRDWSETDSLYGSRHLAAKWSKDGTAAKVKALINVDMIGDKDLGILQDANSARRLRELVWNRAGALGYGAYFQPSLSAIEDDHVPFLRLGLPALDLIDFNYGPSNSYWHTPQDTMDKLGANSFSVVGEVILSAIRELERQS